ncbi:MAG: peptidase S10 [Chloroflexota bacterium]
MSKQTQADNKQDESTVNQNRAGGEKKEEAVQDNIVETQHTIIIDGKQLCYTATAGTIVLKDEDEKEGVKSKASVFFVAYTKNSTDDESVDTNKRPLTISFNGGPGSSSIWMHLGMLGPRRVLSGDVDNPMPPPYQLVDNEHSILDKTDLVFIDPVSTGYSRPVPGEEAKQFHGYEKDIESVGDFIRLYVTRYKRWGSPKFIIGESYGTTRAAGLSGHLQNRYGLYLNGIMLISSILDFQTALFTPGNDLPYILYLPSYTATAWYHGLLDDDLQADLPKALREAERFAKGDYNLALMEGSALSPERHDEIATQVARYTGLSKAYLQQSNLRVTIMRFTKELLRSQGRTVGRFDSRFKGIDRNQVGEFFEYDPSFPIVHGAYTAMLHHYLQTELNYENDLPYEVLKGLYQTWDYNKFKNQFVYVAETLRAAMTQNPFLKVFVGNGYYDLATPYFATEYTFTHLGLDASLQQNISMGYYEAGHMMYVNEASLAKTKVDLAAFIDSAVTT